MILKDNGRLEAVNPCETNGIQFTGTDLTTAVGRDREGQPNCTFLKDEIIELEGGISRKSASWPQP